MSLNNPPLYVAGGDHSGETLRAQIQDAARRNQGVGHTGDLEVSQMDAPAGQVQVAAGTCTITGVAAATQGSYYGVAPDTTLVAIGPTGAGARHDLVVARILDPQYEGARDPDVDCFFIDVVTNVGSGAVEAPGGMTAIPLARIDIPAETTAITQTMITDLRYLANPRRERHTTMLFPSTDNRISSGGWNNWLSFGQIGMPSWARKLHVICLMGGVRLEDGAFAGAARVLLDVGGGVGDALEGVGIDENWTGNPSRFGLVLGGETDISLLASIPSTWRIQANQASGAGKINADTASTVLLDYEFFEKA